MNLKLICQFNGIPHYSTNHLRYLLTKLKLAELKELIQND